MPQTRTVTFEPLEEEPLLSTVRNIEVCAVGIEYPLASGPATFTPEDLIEAVASQDDPSVVAPRVWLGHPDDDRFHKGRATEAGSAEPAIGKLTNMRIEDDGMTLVADAVGVPTWLARILSSAYPSRSIEGYQEAQTVTGHTWKLVITDLALLGVRWPGVSTLDDLHSLFSEDGPDGVEVEEVDMAVAAARAITAQVNVDDVRRAFYANLGETDLSPWSWIRAIQLEPNEIIIDDDEGDLFRASFSIDGEDVEFGDPEQVKIKYVNAEMAKTDVGKSVRASLAQNFTKGRQVAASYPTRDESRANIDQEVTMTPEQLRASLGLPVDATDDQVSAKITELRAQADTPSPDQVPLVPENPAHGPGSPGEGPPPTEAPTKAHPNPDEVGTRRTDEPEEGDVEAAMKLLQSKGLAAVPVAAWQSTQAAVKSLTEKDQKSVQEADTQLLAEAVRKGKVFPAQHTYYAERLKDPNTRDTFRHLLTASVEQGGLAEGLVPVEARANGGGESATVDAYPASWLPEVAQAASNTPITVEG
jgi:hypothetical protein